MVEKKTNHEFGGYTKIDLIGEGAYGKVYKVKHSDTGKIYAMKKLFFREEKEGLPSSAVREIAILNALNHINIVKLVEVIQIEKKLSLVFEFANQDLKKEIDTYNDGLDSIKIKTYLFQLLKGIQYLHDNKILHRDLKPANLLITDQGILKIADFGLSRCFAINTKNYISEVVTLYYRSPDVLLGNRNYLTSIDIWSIGCIFAEMAHGKPLFYANQEIDQLKRIFRILGTPSESNWPEAFNLPDWNPDKFEVYQCQSLSKFVTKLDNNGMDLLGKMLMMNPERRVSVTGALNHPYFDDVPKSILELYS
jgi:cyclin-dependent kinase